MRLCLNKVQMLRTIQKLPDPTTEMSQRTTTREPLEYEDSLIITQTIPRILHKKSINHTKNVQYNKPNLNNTHHFKDNLSS